MAHKGFKRKLTAILSADVTGYSRLMRDNEEATVRYLTAHRLLITEIIQQNNGRVVDSPGDNILAEFASVVDAVNGAIKIQQEIKKSNTGIPEDRRMEFRIGINLGDVIEEDKRIYGDGVNIAARVEGLSEAGGISISGTVYEHIKEKLSLGYHYLGEQDVKNIPEPVKVYRLLTEPADVGKMISEEKPKTIKWRWKALGAIALIILVAGSVAIWYYYFRTEIKPVSDEKMGFLLPDKPSIAVLPFTNLSGNPEQEYFSDGITNDLITALSKFRELLVIASNTIFTYKSKPVNIQNVGQDLGARYIIGGSVQKAGSKVRVNAQLIDATTGYHIWSEIYDRELKDIFSVQDEIVQKIVRKLAIKIDAAERRRVLHKKTESLEAYDYLLRGMEYLRLNTRSGNDRARRMFEKTIELDPEFSSAYVGLANTYIDDVDFGWTEFPDHALQTAHNLALKALSIDESSSGAHRVLSVIYGRRQQEKLAISEAQLALELNPNDSKSFKSLGAIMLYLGRTDESIDFYENALRLDPHFGPGHFMSLGLAFYLKGRYEDAIKTLEQGVSRFPNFAGTHLGLAATYGQLGQAAEARRSAEMVLKLYPFFSIESYGAQFQNPIDRDKIVDGLRKAGLK